MDLRPVRRVPTGTGEAAAKRGGSVEEVRPMAQATVILNGTPGAVVVIDPRLVQIMAIDLLDGEPTAEREAAPQLDSRAFQIMAIANLDDDPVARVAPALAA
jgi:hypothetical protein